MSFERISVIGLGYIGLPTAAMFASRKKKVFGMDVNQHAVDTINKGEIHIVEPDLDMLVHAAVSEGYLSAYTDVQAADAFLIAVPTPFKGENHEPDLSYIESAAKKIAPVLEAGNLVILESTSPVGTTEKMAQWLADARPDLSIPVNDGDQGDVFIAHCPERVLPGHVVRELVENDRLVGGINAQSSLKAAELYQCFVLGECIITNARTAEMAKLTENASRDVQIAFANELSLICDELNINVWELIELANKHPRVNILQPGPGVGGHCIAVDPWFIVSKSPEQARLIRTAREVNDSKPIWVVNKVKQAVADFLMANPVKAAKDVSIACYGIAFKPDIDDLRGSPALQIVRILTEIHPGMVVVVEPNVSKLPLELSRAELVDYCKARDESDIHVMLVDHKSFAGGREPEGIYVDVRGVWH